MKLYVVDVIATFRYKYVIKAKSLEDAYDEVCMRRSGHPDDEFDEVTQRYLGDTIIDGHEIDKEDFDEMLKRLSTDDHEYSSHWLGDKLIREIKYD